MLLAILRFLFWTCPILLCDGLRLTAFVLVLSPGFCRFLWYYAAVARRVTVRYGPDSCRQTLDIYCPDESSHQRAVAYSRRQRRQQHRTSTSAARGSTTTTTTTTPAGVLIHEDALGDDSPEVDQDDEDLSSLLGAPTVVFASGGAWLIGYKMWGCLLARALTARGMMVVLPDYRNYPWGTIPDMVQDMDCVVEWTLQNIQQYGGDSTRVVLAGQSAGGHLGLLSLLCRACRNDTSNTDEDQARAPFGAWKPKDLGGFISLSAPFRVSCMEQTFRKHGLDGAIVDRIFGGQRESYDPWSLLQNLSDDEATFLAENLPPIHLYHGSADKTVPCEATASFATELQQRVRPDISWNVYERWSHTDAILEGVMQGDNRFHDDIVQAVVDWTGCEIPDEDENSRNIRERPLCPKFLVRCGKCLMPF